MHEKHPVHGYHLKDAQGRKSVQEIVREQLEELGQEDKFKQVYRGLHAQLAGNKHRIIRKGDTLFLYELTSPGECHLQVINADSPNNIPENVQHMYTAMTHAGFKTIDVSTKDANVIAAIQTLGDAVQQGNSEGQYTLVSKQ